MKNKKKVASLLLASALMVGVPFSVSAKTAAKPALKPVPPKTVQYVALGDSLAAGQTPSGYIDYGYPDYVASYFTANSKLYKLADFDNFGVRGYTTENVKKDLQSSKKIQKEVKEATHITIDIGANDILGVMKDPSKAQEALAAIDANIRDILAKIDKLNPKAKVFVMGYYNPYPYLPELEQQSIVSIVKLGNSKIEAAAKAHGDTYVPTMQIINVTKDNKFQQYLTNPADIHLSDAGYKVVAAEFWKAILLKK
ncbi:SGNH/GDSL hydrolase family protein [Peribacillus sp. SCS-155]|uniref:SGNH/GDSL hydrolase family protein n=1 Tax=Peribacillus sedimenti TaxID=3115297 RepID=UPI0039060837